MPAGKWVRKADVAEFEVDDLEDFYKKVHSASGVQFVTDNLALDPVSKIIVFCNFRNVFDFAHLIQISRRATELSGSTRKR